MNYSKAVEVMLKLDGYIYGYSSDGRNFRCHCDGRGRGRKCSYKGDMIVLVKGREFILCCPRHRTRYRGWEIYE